MVVNSHFLCNVIFQPGGLIGMVKSRPGGTCSNARAYLGKSKSTKRGWCQYAIAVHRAAATANAPKIRTTTGWFRPINHTSIQSHATPGMNQYRDAAPGGSMIGHCGWSMEACGDNKDAASMHPAKSASSRICTGPLRNT